MDRIRGSGGGGVPSHNVLVRLPIRVSKLADLSELFCPLDQDLTVRHLDLSLPRL